MSTLTALTLTQPWATLIAAGEKQIETRSWWPRGVNQGQRIAIHAGKGLADMSKRQFENMCGRAPFMQALDEACAQGLLNAPRTPERCWFPADLPRGCIVAVARFEAAYSTDNADTVARLLVRYGTPHEWAFGNYTPGRWAWVFTDVCPLREPVPARGKQGLWQWEPPANLETLLRDAVHSASAPAREQVAP